MIEVESVLWGPELDRLPVFAAVRRLRKALREGDPAPGFTLELLFVIPGSLGRPDFEGFKAGVLSERSRRVRLALAVPDQVVRNQTPYADLLDLAAMGVAAVGERAPWLPTTAFLDAIRAAADVVPSKAGRDERSGPSTIELAPFHSHDADASPTDAVVEIRMTLDKPAAHIDINDIDARLRAVVAEHELGDVDGNEVSTHELSWYFVTENPTALTRVVVPILRSVADVHEVSVSISDIEGTRDVPRAGHPGPQ